MRHPERSARPPDSPDVEVLIDGRWLVGELRGWSQLDDGSWWGRVRYRPADEPRWHLGTFPSDRIREPRPETRTAVPAARVAVIIRVRDEWLPGRLYFWTRGPDERWWGRVRWSSGPGRAWRLGTFPAERIRGADTPVARPGHEQTARPWPEWSEEQ